MGELNKKSYAFAVRTVKMVQYLRKERREFTMTQQILRSGTAIGALVRESEFGESAADFSHKLSIALKEANETAYWLSLLHDTDYIDKPMFDSINADCTELIKMLVSSIKTIKSKKVGSE